MSLTVCVCLRALEKELERAGAGEKGRMGGLLEFNSHFSVCRQASERPHLSQTRISRKYTLVQFSQVNTNISDRILPA